MAAATQVPNARKVLVLAAGGTISMKGELESGHEGVLPALDGEGLVEAVEGLSAFPGVEGRTVVNKPSAHLTLDDQLDVCRQARDAARRGTGVVVTHGTDSLEETAMLCDLLHDAEAPIIFTGAIRPASAPGADGPANLLDAVVTARDAHARGVLVVVAGRVWAGAELRKVHSYRIDAFGAGDAGALALIEEGALRWLREVPLGDVLGPARVARDAAQWPRVEIVTSHAGAGGGLVEALVAQGVDGIVAAGTGNGTLHRDLEAALLRAQSAGTRVLRCTRCAAGPVLGQTPLRSAGSLSAPQARVELLLQLLA